MQRSWLRMCERCLCLLELMVRVQPGCALPCLLREGVVQGLCRVLAQCSLMVGVARAVPLALAVVSLLVSLVGVAPSLAGQELILSSLQLHWNSFTGVTG